MEEEKKKITKMTDEILTYYLKRDGKRINIDIEERYDKYIIVATSKVIVSDEEFEDIVRNFRTNKDLEYDFFWELVGEYSEDEELELLFMLADDIKIYYEEEILKFCIEIAK